MGVMVILAGETGLWLESQETDAKIYSGQEVFCRVFFFCEVFKGCEGWVDS